MGSTGSAAETAFCVLSSASGLGSLNEIVFRKI